LRLTTFIKEFYDDDDDDDDDDNHANGYASQHIWCLSQARIKWEDCGRKGIRYKNGGDDGGGSLISPDGVTPSWWSMPSCYLPLHHKVQKKISSGTGSPG